MRTSIYFSVIFLFGCANHQIKSIDGDFEKSTKNIPIYSDFITFEAVDKFISIFKGKKLPEKILVNSAGGNVEAGIRFGHWIFDNKISIEVAGQCGSSCANYVFPAAYHKKIIPPAIVWWHGSMKQQDVLDVISNYEQTLFKKNNDLQLNKDENALLESKVEEKRYFEKIRITKLQDDFYKKIGVSEYVDRIGQKPVSIKSSWMIGVSEMKNFGICNVTADLNYNSDEYLYAWLKQFNGKVRMKHLKMNDEIFEMLKLEISKVDYEINNCF